MTYAQVIERLENIEADLADRQNRYEEAAGDYHRLVRDFDLRLAKAKRASKAQTVAAKKDEALVAVAAAGDDLYTNLVEAEDSYESLRAAIGVLDKRAMIGLGLLKSMTREAFQGGQQPGWSSRESRAVSGVGS